MKTVQFREAIAEAMSEEMRRDESIFLMGEEVAEYNGAYKASKGMLVEFGSKRVIDSPSCELGFGGCGVGSSNRIYRDLETGFSTSGSSRAGSTGSTGVSGTVVRPATLDFTDIGEEATAYSDDNLCEDQTMVGDKKLYIYISYSFKTCALVSMHGELLESCQN